MVSHMTHKSHIKFISFNATMLIILFAEEEDGETAFIDRAIAAGKNARQA